VRAIILAAFFILFSTPFSFAGTIRVVTEEWPPYNYTENGVVVGPVTDAVRAILDRTGLDYTIECLPWARAYGLARHEPSVLIYSILKVADREPLFKWIRLDGLGVDMYLYRPRFRGKIKINTLDDAKGYRVGVTRQSSTHHFLLSKGFVENANLFPVNGEVLNIFKSLPHNKRIDLTTGDPLSLAYWSARAEVPADYWVRLIPLFHQDLYMAFSLKTPDELVEKVRCAYGRLKDEGGLDEIIARFGNLTR